MEFKNLYKPTILIFIQLEKTVFLTLKKKKNVFGCVLISYLSQCVTSKKLLGIIVGFFPVARAKRLRKNCLRKNRGVNKNGQVLFTPRRKMGTSLKNKNCLMFLLYFSSVAETCVRSTLHPIILVFDRKLRFFSIPCFVYITNPWYSISWSLFLLQFLGQPARTPNPEINYLS